MAPSNGDVTREFRMRNASNHPAVGFGTYKCGYLPPSSAQAQTEGDANPSGAGPSASTIVASALDVGYRFLDCAQFYNNEADVGIGIQNSGVPRSELFLASKCWTTAIAEGPSAVRSALCDTLDALKTARERAASHAAGSATTEIFGSSMKKLHFARAGLAHSAV